MKSLIRNRGPLRKATMYITVQNGNNQLVEDKYDTDNK